MKILKILALTLFLSGCANAQSSSAHIKLDVVGETLPAIKHITEMKMSGDTLFFVYEGENGYGQRMLRRAVADIKSHTLIVSSDMGRREDGDFVSYMPYPYIAYDGSVRVIGQDDCEIYAIKNDTSFVRTKQYLMSGNSNVPFPLSQYVKDIFMTEPDRYVFIGREPNGGRQYAMGADLTSSRIDAIRQMSISPELPAWMPNAGEMAYSANHKRLAFGYKFHPVIEIFDLEGNTINSVQIGEDTFNPETLDEADFDALNPIHMIDITYTPSYIYALEWNYADAAKTAPTIYKLDWNGNIMDCYTDLPYPLYKIAAITDSSLLGWNGADFIILIPRHNE